MAQAPCLHKQLITCRLYRLVDPLTQLHFSNSNNSITNSNKPSSFPNWALEHLSIHQGKWQCPPAGTKGLLGSYSLQLPKEALPGGSLHLKAKSSSGHLHLQQFKLQAIHHLHILLAANKLGKYLMPWGKGNYNSSRQVWANLLLHSLKALREDLVEL